VREREQLVHVLPGHDLRQRVRAGDEEQLRLVAALDAQVAQRIDRVRGAAAITVIRYRSSDGATFRSSFCHGWPVGTNTTSSSVKTCATSLAATRWPW